MNEFQVVIPDGVCGEWRVESFTVSQKESDFTRIRASHKGRDHFIPPGDYKRLMRGNTVVMSNTPMEVRTNLVFMMRAHGRVLINGLGLGMVLAEILKKDEVTSVTIVEASKDVIELVGSYYRENGFLHDPRVKIVNADALLYQPEKDERFDVVWHDIWDFISADNLEEMKLLHRKYGRRTDWQGSWCREQCEQMKKESNKYDSPSIRRFR